MIRSPEALAAGVDEISAAVAAIFGPARTVLSVVEQRGGGFHQQFVQTLATGSNSHASAEAAAAGPLDGLLNLINTPTQVLLGAR